MVLVEYGEELYSVLVLSWQAPAGAVVEDDEVEEDEAQLVFVVVRPTVASSSVDGAEDKTCTFEDAFKVLRPFLCWLMFLL